MNDIANYASNLTWLASQASSIVQLCSDIDVNRQQFNKYISGKHLPSRRNRATIAKYFMVNEKDMFLSPESFKLLYQGTNKLLIEAIQSSPRINKHSSNVMKESHLMDKYLGVYYRYQVSSIYKNTVLRSVMYIYKSGVFVYYYYSEKFKNLDNPASTAFTFNYHGICNFLDGKLFLIDAELRQGNEMTFAVLTPIAREPQRMMFGIATGVAANALREPFSTKVALMMEDRGPLKPKHLRMALNLELDDPTIPEEVRIYLGISQGKRGVILKAN